MNLPFRYLKRLFEHVNHRKINIYSNMALTEQDQRELNISQQQLLQLNQQKQLLKLTETELIEKNNKDYIYSGIGKAFFKQNKEDFKKQIKDNEDMIDEHLNAIHKKIDTISKK